MTKYLILKHNGGDPALTGEGWDIVGTREVSSARAAINALLNDPKRPEDLNGGLYAAIPARSWKPVKVEVAQALKFS